MNKSIFLAILIAAAAAIWMGIGLVDKKQPQMPAPLSDEIAANDAAHDTNLPEVRIRELTARPYTQRIILNGRTQASKQIQLRAETDGRILEFPHDEGERVQEGAIIATLDPRDRAERVREAEKLLSQRQIEYNAAKSLENRGYNSRISLAQATSALESARAALKSAKDNLQKTQLKAPFEGVLTGRNVEIGDYVQPGTALITLAQLNPIEVTGFVSEHKITHIEKGDTARIKIRGQHVKDGVITYTAPLANTEARTFEVKITLDNETREFVDGLTVEIEIPLEPQNAYEVSPSVLTLGPDGQIGVKLVDADDKVYFMPADVLADGAGSMWLGGLPDQIRLISLGQDFVSVGTKVNPVPENNTDSASKDMSAPAPTQP